MVVPDPNGCPRSRWLSLFQAVVPDLDGWPWDATGDSPVSLPVHLLHLRLQVLFAVLPPADALGSLSYWGAVLAEARLRSQATV